MSRQLNLLCVLALCALARAHAQDDVEVLYAEPIELAPVAATTVPTTGVAAAKGAAAATNAGSGHRRFQFLAFGRSFELELEPNERIENLRARFDSPADPVAYRGKIAGNEDSWVRLVLGANGPAGLIWDGTRFYAVERPGDSVVAQDKPMIFRLDDAYVAPGTLSCATGETGIMTGSQAIAALGTEFDVAAAQGATLNLDIGAVADSAFVGLHGADSENALLTRLNNVDGIFSEQLGVQISVAQIDILTGADDPFTTTDAGDLLNELALYRGATPAQDAQGLTHLFTGKNLDGTTVGIAYIGALCARKNRFDDRSFGAGLSEGRRPPTTDSLIAAHEIGHSFGAPHDNESGSACESTPLGYLMAPSVSGSDQFSQCSIEQMQPEIASAGCLTPIPQAGLSVTPSVPQPTAAAGSSLVYEIAVRNLGTQSATNVVVHADLAAGAEIIDAAFESGSCTRGAGSADCTAASIPPGALRTLSLTVTAAQPGTYALDAVASANVDGLAINHGIADSVTFEATVDLSLSGEGASLGEGDSTTLTFMLTNLGGFEATDVALTLALDAGLRADGVSLDSAACALDTTPIVCNASTLAARAAVPIVVDLTGVAAGSPRLSIEVTAREPDTDSADNGLTRVVSVRAPAPPQAASSDSGGGGAAGLAWLALLPLLPIARRARRRAAQCQFF